MQNGGMRMFLLGAFAAGAGLVVACAALFLMYNAYQMVQGKSSDAGATATAGAEMVLVRVVQTQNAISVDATRKAATNTPPPVATPLPPATPTLPPAPPATVTPAQPTATSTSTPTLRPPATPLFPVNWFSGFAPKDINRRQAQIDVDYFYNGEWGSDNIMVAALGISGSGAQIFEVNSSSLPIAPGIGHATVMLETGTGGEWTINKVQMCIYKKDSPTPRSYCQEFPFNKTYWKATQTP